MTAAIVLWNTVYLERVINALRGHGQPVLVAGNFSDQHGREMAQVVGYFNGGKNTEIHCYNSEIQVDWKASLTMSKL